ncbi:hypothetical protein PR003_g22830 [Phytophthora rubi]|uniref:Uncharacterized protein n=1 Tax=Phytophthora rubi TaxID=129364 RepID=A0A6A4D4H3_9STRA|nr:hypothetical protein PR002_g22320 [Phytophthora rubi]KAE8990658.1 hypothetical protein PR001_g21431 [Phytophthora rubi]KAE9300084.1 hypothetical protein PR003_g22830 [Phytophthora rubi]
MLSMVNASQSVVSGAAGNTTDTSSNSNSSTSSTTSSSGSMSTGASVAHAIASLAHSGGTNPQEPTTFGHQYNVLTMQPTAATLEAARHHQSINSAANNAAAVLTSVSRVGLQAAPPKKRSTKSKCSPGLRSGKWTMEEEAFTNMIIHYFKRGLLDVEDGTSLRWYLAKRLNCEAMRVTKKLKGNSSIGKQIFRAMENTPPNRQAIRRAREELAVIEARFLESLSAGGVGPGSQHVASAPLPTSLAVSVRGRKILPNVNSSQPTLAPVPKTKPEDAKLLLHFFSEAHNSDEEPEDEQKTEKSAEKKTTEKKTEKTTEKKTEKDTEKKAESGSLTVDLSAKLGKKRPLSSVSTTNADSTDGPKKDAKEPEQQDVASPQSKRQAVEIDSLTE